LSKFKRIDFAGENELAKNVATAWLRQVEDANRVGSPFYVALSGGRIARRFFSAVAEQASGAASLSPVRFFWADERCVPPDDPESNFRVAHELLLEPLKIADDRIHRIRGEESADFAVAEAEAEIRRVAPLNGENQPVLDLILLGIGEDGHVASLFPGEPDSVMSSPAVYRKVTAIKPPPLRITLGYAAIAAARQVWVLASGPGKETALRTSLEPAGLTPLARVIKSRVLTRIFTDIVSGKRASKS
jgi:6-phosphogluconolactonase